VHLWGRDGQPVRGHRSLILDPGADLAEILKVVGELALVANQVGELALVRNELRELVLVGSDVVQAHAGRDLAKSLFHRLLD
jgi:hypothetical protein